MSPRRSQKACPICRQPWVNAKLTLACGCTITAHVEPASARSMRDQPDRLVDMRCLEHGDTHVFSYRRLSRGKVVPD